jgi:ABC-type transport system involved in cytochrome c biogenesis ATPase subunit
MDTLSLWIQSLGWDGPQGSVIPSLTAELGPGLVYITGDEGVGKTCLLSLLAGRLMPSRGQILLRQEGRSVAMGQLSSMVAWIDPRKASYDDLSVKDFIGKQEAHYPQWSQLVFDEIQYELGLEPHLGKHIYMLSAGTKRKLWLASVLAAGAPITLLDEPFAALDKASMVWVKDLLQEVSDHPTRLWVVADYEVPPGITPGRVIALPS